MTSEQVPQTSMPAAVANVNDSPRLRETYTDAPVRSNTLLSPESEAVTDTATIAFIRRTLCVQNTITSTISGSERGDDSSQPIEELLPPLTSSNEVDLQVYAILAVILREFVLSWYSKITPDHVFIEEVLRVIAHCTRALEQRLRHVDLEDLLLDEIPGLVEQHVQAYRIAQATSTRNQLAEPLRRVYHTINPHPALAPVPVGSDATLSIEQRHNEISWRQLTVQGILAVLLPTEDLENGCLRALVAEIFSEMILGAGIGEKACEPWLLWEIIAKLAETVPSESTQHEQHEQPATTGSQWKTVDASGAPAQKSGDEAMTISKLFWLITQYLFLAGHAIRTIVTAFASSSSLPLRGVMEAGTHRTNETLELSQSIKVEKSVSMTAVPALKRPVISMNAWSCVFHLLEVESRMPWIAGIASLMHWVAVAGSSRIGDTNGLLDRLLSHYIQTVLLKPALVPSLLRTLRMALFPRNTLAPARPPPSDKEILLIKRQCAKALLHRLPKSIRTTYFVTNAEQDMMEQVEDMLSVLGDKYCNKTVMYSIVELLIVRLIPELQKFGVTELMEQRLGEAARSVLV